MKQLNWYQIFGNTHKIPDGRTVEPTDDIQIWLHCANIWDKSYTTLAEVLADTDTLLALISSNNAVDYMVRSTTWAVATAFVPNMTGYTTPEGEVLYSSEYPGIPAWQLFDGDNSTRWVSYAATDYAGYKFTSKKIVSSLWYYQVASNATELGRLPKNFTLQGSNDGSTWTDIQSYVGLQQQNNKFSTTNTTEYQYYRINITSNYGQSVIQINELQFYSASVTDNATAMTYIGQNNYAANTLLADATWCNAICNSEYFESVLNVKVPVMTSATTPEGVVTCSYEQTSPARYAWYAFDGEINNWTTGSYTTNQWIQYQFTSSVRVCCVTITTDNRVKNFKVQTVAGGNTTDIYSDVFPSGLDEKTRKYAFFNSVSAENWRLHVTDIWSENPYPCVSVYELQFYGRKDV